MQCSFNETIVREFLDLGFVHIFCALQNPCHTLEFHFLTVRICSVLCTPETCSFHLPDSLGTHVTVSIFSDYECRVKHLILTHWPINKLTPLFLAAKRTVRITLLMKKRLWRDLVSGFVESDGRGSICLLVLVDNIERLFTLI